MKAILRFTLLSMVALPVIAEPPAPTPVKPPVSPPASPPTPPILPMAQSTVPWLGFDIGKADETTTAQLPSLPPGIGFVVKSIESDGPAAAAGIQELDVVWKFGEQLLVNEGQLAALLRLHKPGDKVTLSLFRGGKHAAAEIALGVAPVGRRNFRNDLIDAAIMPGGGSRMINLANRTAVFNNEDGRAILRRSDDDKGYEITIHGPDEAVLFQGNLNEEGNAEGLPNDWRRRVCALRRGLDHALEGRMVPVRPPRPRVTPPPTPAN